MLDLFNGTRIIVPLRNSIDSSYLDNTVNYIKLLIKVEPSISIKKNTLGWVIELCLSGIYLTRDVCENIASFFGEGCHIECDSTSNFEKLFSPYDNY